jgi:hypothetical protein
MKLLAAGIALLLLSSAGAEAGLFGSSKSKPKLPKPIDSPIVRPNQDQSHKAGKRAGNHPEKFQRPDYGAEWGKILSVRRHHEVPDYLYQQQ